MFLISYAVSTHIRSWAIWRSCGDLDGRWSGGHGQRHRHHHGMHRSSHYHSKPSKSSGGYSHKGTNSKGHNGYNNRPQSTPTQSFRRWMWRSPSSSTPMKRRWRVSIQVNNSHLFVLCFQVWTFYFHFIYILVMKTLRRCTVRRYYFSNTISLRKICYVVIQI